jgi:transposase InsO family protein
VESFFSSLKKEKIRRYMFKTREEARAEIFDYIGVFYNRARRHQHVGNISPEAYEEQMAKSGECPPVWGKSNAHILGVHQFRARPNDP